MTLPIINWLIKWLTDFWIQRLQSTAELTWTHVTFLTILTIDQKDKETWPNQQEDKDKDKNKDKGQGIGSYSVI